MVEFLVGSINVHCLFLKHMVVHITSLLGSLPWPTGVMSKLSPVFKVLRIQFGNIFTNHLSHSFFHQPSGADTALLPLVQYPMESPSFGTLLPCACPLFRVPSHLCIPQSGLSPRPQSPTHCLLQIWCSPDLLTFTPLPHHSYILLLILWFSESESYGFVFLWLKRDTAMEHAFSNWLSLALGWRSKAPT